MRALACLIIALCAAAPLPAGAQSPSPQRMLEPRLFTAEVMDDAALTRLLDALRKTSGVSQAEGRLREGTPARVRVIGEAPTDLLLRAAKGAGFELKPDAAPAVRFVLAGEPSPQEVEKLRAALAKLDGVGPIQTRATGQGVMFGFPQAKVAPERIVAAAKAAGFELRPVMPGGFALPGEKNSPAALEERIEADLTKVGDLAPDFTLITRDGKQKITLSDYRAKKPVVLVFGSYT